MTDFLIKHATLVNEAEIKVVDVLIANERIEKIGANLSAINAKVIDAEGLHLLPGMIDAHVHFREPGLTHKGTISTESRAAIAGGITSFMDMPNTQPAPLTLELLENKYKAAAKESYANYSFFMGISKHNLEEALLTNPENVCGISDDGLYFDNEDGILANYPLFLEKLFSRSNTLIALHSEDDSIIKVNSAKWHSLFGEDIPVSYHPLIRSEDACLVATERIIQIASKYANRVHLLHISTAAEPKLLSGQLSVRQKRITAEACVHHLYFDDADYAALGNRIKWNPAIKTKGDKNGLMEAIAENRLDTIATDHAPHTIAEKSGNYFTAKPGGPMVQHALPALLELYHQGKMSLQKIVEKTSHSVAEAYRIKERGYIREGYFADLVLLDLNDNWKVDDSNILYKCKWSPFAAVNFKSRVLKTFVNGNLLYSNGQIVEGIKGKRLQFEKLR